MPSTVLSAVLEAEGGTSDNEVGVYREPHGKIDAVFGALVENSGYTNEDT